MKPIICMTISFPVVVYKLILIFCCGRICMNCFQTNKSTSLAPSKIKQRVINEVESIMVNVKKGVLINCDPALKQFIKHLDEKLSLGDRFIIEELDDRHLFVESEYVARIERKIEAMMDQLTADINC